MAEAFFVVLDILCSCYLVAVFLCLPTIGYAYQEKKITTEDLLHIGAGCVFSMLELCLF